jgi:outer membrane receptor protein involved in Fe transport
MPLRRPPLVCVLASMLLGNPIAPPAAAAQEAEPPAPPGAPVVEETITVTATRSARPVEQTPGHVSVIGRGEIERRLAADTADLVRFQPGVYVDGAPTRLGLSGFNVRGIGGNRVMTRLDGVATADEFSFGPLAIHQVGLDVEALERVEIVRSAGSALYGSDALGGVVSLVTRDPLDYLAAGGPAYLGARAGWDGRADEASESLATAYDGGRWQASLWLGRRDGEARDNQGTVDSLDDTRTRPNPIDRAVTSGLGKLTFAPSDASHWKLSAELFDSEVETEVLSGRGVQDLGASFGPGVTFRIDTSDFDARDTQRRGRLILENLRTGDLGVADGLSWRLWAQRDETDQRTLERRVTTQGGGFFGPPRTSEVERTAGSRSSRRASAARSRRTRSSPPPGAATASPTAPPPAASASTRGATASTSRSRRGPWCRRARPSPPSTSPRARSTRSASSCRTRSTSGAAGCCWCPGCAGTASTSTPTRTTPPSSPATPAPCRRPT